MAGIHEITENFCPENGQFFPINSYETHMEGSHFVLDNEQYMLLEHESKSHIPLNGIYNKMIGEREKMNEHYKNLLCSYTIPNFYSLNHDCEDRFMSLCSNNYLSDHSDEIEKYMTSPTFDKDKLVEVIDEYYFSYLGSFIVTAKIIELFKKYVDPDYSNYRGENDIMIVCKNKGNHHIIPLLIDNNNVYKTNIFGENILMLYVKSLETIDLDKLSTFLEMFTDDQNKFLLNHQDIHGEDIFRYILKNNRMSVGLIDLLVKKGYDINGFNELQNPVIFDLFENVDKNIKLIEHIIKKNIFDCGKVDIYGNTPIMKCFEIMNMKEKNDKLVKIFYILLNKPTTDINARNNLGKTLFYEIMDKHYGTKGYNNNFNTNSMTKNDFCRIILNNNNKNKLSINDLSHDGKLLLEIVCLKNDFQTFRSIVNYPSFNPNTVNNKGQTIGSLIVNWIIREEKLTSGSNMPIKIKQDIPGFDFSILGTTRNENDMPKSDLCGYSGYSNNDQNNAILNYSLFTPQFSKGAIDPIAGFDEINTPYVSCKNKFDTYMNMLVLISKHMLCDTNKLICDIIKTNRDDLFGNIFNTLIIDPKTDLSTIDCKLTTNGYFLNKLGCVDLPIHEQLDDLPVHEQRYGPPTLLHVFPKKFNELPKKFNKFNDLSERSNLVDPEQTLIKVHKQIPTKIECNIDFLDSVRPKTPDFSLNKIN